MGAVYTKILQARYTPSQLKSSEQWVLVFTPLKKATYTPI